MTLEEMFQELDLSEYVDAILNSNSRGELMHVAKYRPFLKIPKEDRKWFKPAFVRMVEHSKSFERPASVYQHVDRIFGYVDKEDQELAFCLYHREGWIEDRDYIAHITDPSFDEQKREANEKIQRLTNRINEILESRKQPTTQNQ